MPLLTLTLGDIKRGILSDAEKLGQKIGAGQLGPAVFKRYQEVVAELLQNGTQRIVVDGLDPQYWRGQVCCMTTVILFVLWLRGCD